MVTENFVNFETAKLLKEKDFDESCPHYYEEDKPSEGPFFNPKLGYYLHNKYDYVGHKLISAPTNQVVLKWLREVHQIYISIECCYDKSVYYTFDIFRIKDNHYEFIGCSSPGDEEDDWSVNYTYEKAENRVIKYCLEHLL